MRLFVARILSRLGIPHLSRALLAKQAGFALVFHDIIRERRTDLAPESQYGLTVSELDRMLNWLSKRFAFITPQQFLTASKPGILLTIDDGKANNYTNALPVLERHQAPAILFVTTQHVVNPRDWLPHTRKCARSQWSDVRDIPDDIAWEYFNGMTPEQVAICGQHPLITIGAHTVSHPFLTECDQPTLERELTASKKLLEGIINQPVSLFAYPTGVYDRRVAEAVRDAGYRYAFALKPKGVTMRACEVPRVYIRETASYYLDVKLSGIYARPVKSPI